MLNRTTFTALALTVASASTLTACATGPMAGGQATTGTQTTTQQPNRTAIGAGLGAAAGALAGYFSSGNDDDRRKNAVIGAGIGALAGGTAGYYMNKQEAALREELADTGVTVSRQGENILLNMPSSITFGFDQATVQSQFMGTLNNISNVLVQYPSTFVDVIGHTDSVGTEAYNQDLSQRRAQAVANVLVNQGVQPQRLVVRGLGEQFPIASNATDAGRAQNRRVEIMISPVREGM